MKPTILIGADPELFAFKKGTMEPVSVHDFIPGYKFKPFKVPLGAIQVDGVSAEFNIEPAKNRKEFMKNIGHVWSLLDRIVAKERPELELAAIPTATFNKTYFEELPDHAKALGCEPDYNAYTMEENVKPETEEPFRTGSGHIHVGWTDLDNPFVGDHFKNCCVLTKQLDSVLFMISSLWDKDEKRRSLYGQKGAFRPKKYGVEYRVLSNAWLNKKETQAFVFDTVKTTTARFLKGFHIQPIIDKVRPQSLREYCELLKDYHFPDVRDYLQMPR